MRIIKVIAEEKNEKGTIYTVLVRRWRWFIVTREVLDGIGGAQWLDTGEDLPSTIWGEGSMVQQLNNQVTVFHARQSRFKAAGI